MKLGKLFIALAIGTFLFTTSCGGGAESKGADLWCEMAKLEKEKKTTEDDARKEEIKVKIKEMWEQMMVLDTEMKEKFKDDKKGELKASIEIQKALLDCDAMDEKAIKQINKQIEKSEKKLEEME